MLSKKIIILDDVLSHKECETLIKCYKDHGATHEWRGTFPMTIDPTNDFLRSIVGSVENAINELLSKKITVDWCEIVAWPKGSGQSAHYDTASPETVFTSITYLNDRYTGGRTFIVNDIEVVPKVGRTVAFDGNHYLHGVTEVTDNFRYTLPIWYKKV
jgi:hypothetical protein